MKLQVRRLLIVRKNSLKISNQHSQISKSKSFTGELKHGIFSITNNSLLLVFLAKGFGVEIGAKLRLRSGCFGRIRMSLSRGVEDFKTLVVGDVLPSVGEFLHLTPIHILAVNYKLFNYFQIDLLIAVGYRTLCIQCYI